MTTTPLSYDEKLLIALRHPIREWRMTAIGLLGRPHYAPAVTELARMLATDGDIYVLREVLRALRAIDSVEARAVVLHAAEGHPLRLVRKLARALCNS
jgi:hypothetical protein